MHFRFDRVKIIDDDDDTNILYVHIVSRLMTELESLGGIPGR